MVKYYTYLLLLLITCSLHVSAKQGNNNIQCLSAQMHLKNDSVHIYMVFELGRNLSANQTVELTPWLNGTSQTCVLPPLLICGKNKFKLYKRYAEFMSSDKNRNGDIGQSGELRRDTPQSDFEIYKTVVPFESWMKDATLEFTLRSCNCGNIREIKSHKTYAFIPSEETEADSPEENKSIPDILESDVHTATKVQPRDTTTRVFESTFYYPEGESRVEFQIGGNYMEWMRLTELMTQYECQEILITDIETEAFASPEGTFVYNRELAGHRAMRLRFMITDHWDIPEQQIRVSYPGEDWDGLIKLIGNTCPPYRTEVLDIIRSYGIFKGREKKLMLLQQGKPYLEMRKNLFPLLRKAHIRIRYKNNY